MRFFVAHRTRQCFMQKAGRERTEYSIAQCAVCVGLCRASHGSQDMSWITRRARESVVAKGAHHEWYQN